jgi:hypothetical protein
MNDETRIDDASGLGSSLLYGGVAIGVLAGAALSTYLWRQRVRALDLLNVSPLQRAEQLISSCEGKLDSIERAVAELKAAR